MNGVITILKPGMKKWRNEMNNVILIGRLTKDSELKYIQSGTAVSNFSIAVDKSYKKDDQKETNFFDVVIWGKTAESLNQYLTKGKQIALQGELEQQRWKSGEGENRSKVIITARNIQLLGGDKKKETLQEDVSMRKRPMGDEVSDDFEDDIPF